MQGLREEFCLKRRKAMTQEEKEYYNRPSLMHSDTIAAICFASMAVIVAIVFLVR
jgi:hypothetical protein